MSASSVLLKRKDQILTNDGVARPSGIPDVPPPAGGRQDRHENKLSSAGKSRVQPKYFLAAVKEMMPLFLSGIHAGQAVDSEKVSGWLDVCAESGREMARLVGESSDFVVHKMTQAATQLLAARLDAGGGIEGLVPDRREFTKMIEALPADRVRDMIAWDSPMEAEDSEGADAIVKLSFIKGSMALHSARDWFFWRKSRDMAVHSISLSVMEAVMPEVDRVAAGAPKNVRLMTIQSMLDKGFLMAGAHFDTLRKRAEDEVSAARAAGGDVRGVMREWAKRDMAAEISVLIKRDVAATVSLALSLHAMLPEQSDKTSLKVEPC